MFFMKLYMTLMLWGVQKSNIFGLKMCKSKSYRFRMTQILEVNATGSLALTNSHVVLTVH